ncbi:putative inactive purple acid phosphatase 1 [Gossypium australe]|uniref:Purple acid phosphatase n=1 Tax=Gossypium australe TaxID=47621 RepID=A0A5B6X4J3_9ROSI|nr:putative inactive purple acid phosphatase 1 [Gossypium australe]
MTDPMMRELGLILLSVLLIFATLEVVASHGDQPLSTISVQKATFALHHQAYIKVSPTLLGLKGQNTDWVTVEFSSPNPSVEDWIGVFSPSNFSASSCTAPADNPWVEPPLLCSAPIKYQYANYSTPKYKETGKGSLKLQLINQRSDFSFALFSGGLSNPKVVAVSNKVAFSNPKAPVYPRLAQGKVWNEYCEQFFTYPAYYYFALEIIQLKSDSQMTVTWTSGYGIGEAVPFVEWGPKGGQPIRSPAGTLTFDRNSISCTISKDYLLKTRNALPELFLKLKRHLICVIMLMCSGEPARTVGWRDPGFIHTSFLKELWPNTLYTYKLGHILSNGTYVWSQEYKFRASPYPGQNSLQRVVIFGDMGKAEADGSNEYNDFQHGSLNTTKQLIRDLNNIDIAFLIGDICYANGYLSQWDQFTAQAEPIASTVPFMIASGNHERDWPGSGSFFGNKDSGGECGVLAETMFYVPTENRAKYSTDYGMFRFCVADTEHDWREGTEQYQFIEHCLASVDRRKQPWLIFLAHRVLGYSSATFYADTGSFGEPMGRESLQKLWQKYKVDIAIYGHAHHYERTCPIYQNICTNKEKQHYKGAMNGTIHVVAGGGGAGLAEFTTLNTKWSLFKDYDYGFVKLTAFDHSSLLFEYKKSSDGKVYDSFTISRDYRDILACTVDSCPSTTLAS